MGHLPSAEYVGAVAVGGLIFNFIFWGLRFLRMGTTGITAQAFGTGDIDEVRASLIRALLISVALAVIILALQNLIAWVSFTLIDGSLRVESLATIYFSTRIWSTPASLANLVVIGWFIGLQNTKIPLILLLVSNGCNILLDLLFVLVFEMDIHGIALATVIAEYLGLIIGIGLIYRAGFRHPSSWRWTTIAAPGKITHMLTINRHIFVRTLCLILVFAFFTAQSAKQGDVILAANAALLNFYTLMAYGLDGIAYAAEALIGKTIGSRNRTGLKASVKACAQWSTAIALLFCSAYAAFGVNLIGLMTTISAVAHAAQTYLPWAVIAPIISAPSFLLDGIFIGATRGREMQNSMIFAAALIFIPSWHALQPYGNHGLWGAFMLFMVARGISMAWLYRRIASDPMDVNP